MVQGLPTLLGGGDGYLEVALDDVLANVVGQTPGPEARIEGNILFMRLT